MKQPTTVHLAARGPGRGAVAFYVLYFAALEGVEVAVRGVPKRVLYKEMVEARHHRGLDPRGFCCRRSGIKTCIRSAW